MVRRLSVLFIRLRTQALFLLFVNQVWASYLISQTNSSKIINQWTNGTDQH